jgi:hypothetical protein
MAGRINVKEVIAGSLRVDHVEYRMHVNCPGVGSYLVLTIHG